MPQPMLTVNQAAEELTVTPHCVRQWLARGLVQGIKIGPLQLDAAGRDRRPVRLRHTEVQRLISPLTHGDTA